MRRTALVSWVLLLLLAGCGSEETTPSADPTASTAPGGVPPMKVPPKKVRATMSAAEPDESCDEVTKLDVSFGDEPIAVGDFEVTHTAGFIAGMRYNGERTAKLAYLVFANYEPRLTSYNLDPPKEEGQVALMITFKTESKDVPFKQQMDEYKKMTLPTGAYGPGWMKREAIFQVVYYVGGEKAGSGPAISDDAKGEATLTHATAGLVCGSIDFTSEKGTTIKGTFSVPIEKDMWVK